MTHKKKLFKEAFEGKDVVAVSCMLDVLTNNVFLVQINASQTHNKCIFEGNSASNKNAILELTCNRYISVMVSGCMC